MRYQETDLAWTAGFLEGEGSFIINLRREGRNVTACVRAAQVDKSPLLKLQRLFGGSISVRAAYGNHQRAFYWAVSTSFCADVLPLLVPYMTGAKKKQAVFMAKFAQRCQMRRQNGQPVNEIELAYRQSAREKLTLMRAA